MPPTPPGLVPYAGPAIQDPYGETLLQMMQQQSERQYEHAMREAQRSADKWGAGADFIGSLYPAYLQQQELQRAEEDRQRAIEDRKRLHEATVREEARDVAGILRTEAIEDAESLGTESRLTQADLAIGHLPSTPYEAGSTVDEMGRPSIKRGEPIAALAPTREDIVRLPGGGFATSIPSGLPGEDPTLRVLTDRETTERLDPVERARLGLIGAQVGQIQDESGDPQDIGGMLWRRDSDGTMRPMINPETGEPFRTDQITEYQRQALAIQREQGQPRLTYPQQSSATEEALLHSFAAMSRGEDPLFTASDAIGGLSQYNVDGKAFIRGVHENAVNIRGGELLRGWLGTEEGRDSMSEHLTLTGGDVDNYTAPQEQQERFLSQARLEIPLADFMAGGAPAPETREVVPPPVPNLREIVEDALQPGKWPRQDVSAQVAEFKNAYGLGTIEEAANLYRDVDDAVRSIRESVKQEESGPMTWEESVTARPKPRADESYESYQLRRQREQELGHLSAMAPVNEQNAKLLSEAANRYFSTLTPTP